MTDCSPLVCRRTVLRRLAVGGGIAAAGVLAGCGGDESTAPSASDGSSASGGEGGTNGDGGQGGGGQGGDGGGGGKGTVLGPAADVEVGGGVIYADALIVVTQPTKGDYKGFTAVCTHQQCPVTSIEDGEIVCSCHGSRYSIEDGSVVSGPAPAALAAEPIAVKGGDVTVA
ncbi:hypothetical protein BH20ACT6_BH20ACT6_03760 [soil metagenome]